MGVRRASLEAHCKNAPFTRALLPRARAGCWQAHQLPFVWVASAWLADCGPMSNQSLRGLPLARKSKWNPWMLSEWPALLGFAVDTDAGCSYAARRLGVGGR